MLLVPYKNLNTTTLFHLCRVSFLNKHCQLNCYNLVSHNTFSEPKNEHVIQFDIKLIV